MKLLIKMPFCSLAASLILSPAIFGQSETVDEDAEVFTLNPFTISGADDEGYRATTTLSGTRIKTNIGDIGTAIQSITEQFLDDTGVTTMEELLTYATNTESAGAFGNFGDPSPNGSRTFVGADSNRDSRNGQVSRIRGLADADTARNLYRTNIPLDSYNVSRVEVNRGANSMLFGTGSPAGIVNYQTNETVWSNQNEVELRLDNEGSHRVVVDFNRVLIEDKLALRLIGLNNERNFKQDPAYRNDNRYFLSTQYNLFENTNLSGSFERGYVRSTLPRTTPPVDYFTNWFDFGKPTIALNGDERDGTTDNLLNTHVTSSATTNQILLDATGGNPDPFAVGVGRIGSTSTFFSGIPNGQADFPDDWRKKYASFNSTRAILDALTERPEYSGAGLLPTSGENAPLQVLDTSVFDYHNNVLDGLQSWNDNDFETYNIALRQEFLEGNLGFELAYNSEEFASFSNDALDSIRGYVLQIDSNEGGFQYTDPGDSNSGESANPYFGRVYFGSRSVYSHNKTKLDTKRFTGYVRHDFTSNNDNSLLNRVLGSHTLTLMGEDVNTDSTSVSGRTSGFDPNGWGDTLGLTGGDLYTTGRSSAGVIFYISDDISDRSTASGLNLTGYKGPRYLPNEVAVDYWDEEQGRIVNGTFLLNDIESGMELTNTSASLGSSSVESMAAVLQSKWYDGNIITTLGWREDEISTIGNGPADRRANGSYVLDSLTLSEDVNNESSVPTQSKSVVVKASKLINNWVPLGFDFDLYYAESDNFRTSGGTLYAAKEGGMRFGRQMGETEEMGISFSLFENKLYARLNWYETRQTNLSDEDANSVVRAYRQVANGVYDNNTLAEIQSAGFSVPEHFESEFGWVIVDNGDGTGFIETDPTAHSNRGDVEDAVSKGVELEVVFNITENWRLFGNVAKSEAVTTGAGTNIKDDVDYILNNWVNNASVAALYTDPAGPAAGPLGTVGGFANARVVAPYETLLSLNGQSSSEIREWRVNLVTNYAFSENSFLSGFDIGGGMRYQSSPNLGYRYEDKPDGTRGADVNSPIEGPSETNYDLWIGYEVPLFDGSVDWRLQLNIRNVFTGDELIPIVAQGNDNYSKIPEFSEHAATNYQLFRIAPPRVIELRSTFKF